MVGLFHQGSLGPIRIGVTRHWRRGTLKRTGIEAIGSSRLAEHPRKSLSPPGQMCRFWWRGRRGVAVVPTELSGSQPSGTWWRSAGSGAGTAVHWEVSHWRPCHKTEGGASGSCWLLGAAGTFTGSTPETESSSLSSCSVSTTLYRQRPTGEGK